MGNITRLALPWAFLATGLPLVQDPFALRYTYEVNAEAFPQKTPEEAMKSIVRALGTRKIDYLMAQLADPAYVDLKVADYKKVIPQGKDQAKGLQAFQRLVKETEEHFLEDPALIRDLKRFAKEAEWKIEENSAVGIVKDLAGRQVFLRRLGERWFLENKQQREKEAPK